MTNQISTFQHTRVVIDTNIWLSGLIYGGNPKKILDLFIQEELVVITSEELITEIHRKITQKFPGFAPQLYLLEASIRVDATVVKLGSVTIKKCRDKEDNKVIETAIIGGCSYIISGDNDLLSLKKYKNIKIVSPSEFLFLFE